MRAPSLLLLVAGCSAGAEPPPANHVPLVIGRRMIGSNTAPAAPPTLSYADLIAVEGTSLLPGTIDWNTSYTDLVRRFGPVTRVVDRKYFWAATDGDRCAMFWIGKRKRLNQVAVAVGVLSTEPGGFGHDWCIAMASNGPLPARRGRHEPPRWWALSRDNVSMRSRVVRSEPVATSISSASAIRSGSR